MTIRPACPDDVDVMCRIIGRHASEGLMLPRSKSGLLTAIQHYLVADLDGNVVGCGGLQPYSAASGEIYGLATAPGESPRGTGSAIVQELVRKARSHNLSKVFALTLAPEFFRKLGFRVVEHHELPLKVWTDCVACPKFGHCDEIAMVLDLL
jgi:amino-acid N-acetyltransferase